MLYSFKKEQYPFENALLHYALSLSYCAKGDYSQSFLTGLHACEEFKKQKNNIFISRVLASLGTICFYVKSYDMAKDYFQQALNFKEDILSKQYRTRMNLYTVLCIIGDSTAIDDMSEMIPAFSHLKDTALLSMLYMNLGSLYSMRGEYQTAKQYYEKILSLISSINNDEFTFGLYQNIGLYYLLYYTDQPDKSKSYFEKAKAIATTGNNMEQLSHVCEAMSAMFEKMGNTDSAFVYLKKHKDLSTSITDKTKPLEAAYRTSISTALESSQKELTIAKHTLQLQSRHLIITIGFSIGVILVISLFLMFVQQKKRFKEAENRDLEERLQSKQQIEKLQEERIEAQSREITSHALMLSNKNQVLQQISEVIKKLPQSQEEAREVNYIIKNNLKMDDAWDNFMLHFEKVNPDFFNKLNALDKGLSKSDLRLCAYIRIGLYQKQIAQILNVSYGSIRTHGYRLKKKLGLTEEQELDNFIKNI